MPHLSRYYTLYVVVRGIRIWPPNAAKCCKNAGKFFPDEGSKEEQGKALKGIGRGYSKGKEGCIIRSYYLYKEGLEVTTNRL